MYSNLKMAELQILDGSGADPADVRSQEHDGGLQPHPRQIPHRRRRLQGQDVHEGGRRTAPQYSE